MVIEYLGNDSYLMNINGKELSLSISDMEEVCNVLKSIKSETIDDNKFLVDYNNKLFFMRN